MLPDAVILTQKDFLTVLTWLIWKQLVRGRHSAGNFHLAQTKAKMMAGSSAQTKGCGPMGRGAKTVFLVGVSSVDTCHTYLQPRAVQFGGGGFVRRN